MRAFRPAIVAIALFAFAACSGRGAIPRWVESPPEDERFWYGVGVRSGAPSLEEARRGAVEQAVAELVRRFGIRSQTTYEEVRRDIETRVREELLTRSENIEIEEAVVQEFRSRRGPEGHEAFVLVRYPREAAALERERMQRKDAVVRGRSHAAMRRADAAAGRGDLSGALRSFADASVHAEAAREPGTLQSRIEQRRAALAASCRIDLVRGDGQAAAPYAGMDEPVVVRIRLGEVPCRGCPLYATITQGEGQVTPEILRSDDDGFVQVSVQALRSSSNVVGLRMSVFPGANSFTSGQGALDSPNAAREFESCATEVRIAIVAQERSELVGVLVDERQQGQAQQRSVAAPAVVRMLRAAGFRVVADHEIGKTNRELLARMVQPGDFLSLDRTLAGRVDILVAGWCDTSVGSGNLGWAASARADCDLRAVRVSNGEVVGRATVLDNVGFGERMERAESDALRRTAEQAALELVQSLSRGGR